MSNFRRASSGILAALVLQVAAGGAFAATVSQWSGNTNVWSNSGNFSTFYAEATAAPLSHTITSGAAITAASLTGSTHLVIESSAAQLTGTELSLLTQWVQGGGTLLLFAGSSNATASQVLGSGGLNSSIAVSNSNIGFGSSTVYSNLSLTTTNTAVTGGPFDLRGASFNLSNNFKGVTGGEGLGNSALGASQALRTESVQLGKIFVMGGHFESNGFLWESQSNMQFFLNVLAQGQFVNGLVEVGTPEPASIALTGFALGGLLLLRRKRF